MPVFLDELEKQTQQIRAQNEREAAKLNAEMPGRVEFAKEFREAEMEQRLAMWDKAVEYQIISSDADALASYQKAAQRSMTFIDRIEAQQKAKGRTLADLSPKQQETERQRAQDNGLGDD